MLRLASSALALGASLLSACASAPVPDPREAARAYAEAARAGDVDAAYALLSEDGRRALTREELGALLTAQRAEHAEQAEALAAPGVRVEAEARLRFADGEHATLVLEDGAFRVASADALPTGARSPTEALEQLRRALARRSYAAMLRVLSSHAKTALEDEARALVEGLEQPEGLMIEVTGDVGEVVLPSGHRLRLLREDGVWRVDDVD